jgi:CRP-like cAMP-binding protein
LGWDQAPPAANSKASPLRSLSETERIQIYEQQISRIAKASKTKVDSDSTIDGAHQNRYRPGNDNESDDSRMYRGTIFCCAVSDLENDDFEIPSYKKTDKQASFLYETLQNNFIFTEMTSTECKQFVGAMQQEQVSAGTKIIQQGAIGDFFYIVESGTVDFVQDQAEISKVVPVGSCQGGASFGELALLFDSPRAVSCIASTPATLWKVDRRTFRHLMARHDHHDHKEMKDLIRKISIFKGLDTTTISRFVKSLTPVHWKEGTRIVQKGEEGSVFYIIQSGNVKVHDIGLGDSKLDDLVLGPGDWFGERALLTGEPRAANVTALNEVTTMAMDRETFEARIGPLQNLMEREMRKQSLKAIPIFATGKVTDSELEQLADLMQEVCYRKGDHLAETGKPYQMRLWIIRHGRLVIYSQKHDKLYNLQAGDHFGDKSVKGADPNHISSYTATCEENLTTWYLTRDQIESVIVDIERLGKSENFSTRKRDQSIRLQDLKRYRMIGRGSFGRVWLVGHQHTVGGNTTATAYALKSISKIKVIGAKLDKAVMREKELLCLLDHPFILSLVASYQDENNLYLLSPLVLGGELYGLLRNNKSNGRGMENNAVAFYAACIIEALGHFHLGHRVAYRDLKLENVMLDEQGYGKIVDLGFAKVVIDKTYTLCGTPEMLAPELILSKGHDQAVDYWAFGVVIYELLVGHSPFYIRGSSEMDMFKRIVLVKYEIPSYVDDSAKILIQKLLVRRQSSRLGNLANGYRDIKQHQWFVESGISFKHIIRKETEAPWKPQIKDPFDASNFGDMTAFENEREVGRRLTREEQEIFRGF